MESHVFKTTRFFILGVILLGIITGCSGGSSSTDPITLQSSFEKSGPGNLETLPIIAFDGETAIGMLGGYNLTISNGGKNAELVPMRTSAIGEAYIVSGLAYFTIKPCNDCLKIISIALDTVGNITLGFAVKHPFPKGDPSKKESGLNRLDLDIFDLALVVKPLGKSPTAYTIANAYSSVVLNTDGYTNELSGVTGTNAVLPYKICYESSNNNRFEMGTDYQSFDCIFSSGAGLSFDLYLTMGYGASAKKLTRLTPTYYVPEFNRKAAWKIQVDPVTWYASDPSTVEIDIYDWNHGATIAGSYPDPVHTNYIRASSDVQSVSVEVPGMTNTVKTANLTDSSTNGWDDPLTYSATFTNENLLPDGLYTGIVKVVDSRVPGIPGSSDSLLHTPDGISIEQYGISQFVTYQTFIASITSTVNNPPTWDSTVGILSATPGDSKVTITFGTATDPDGDNPVTYDLYYVDETSTGNNNPFISPNIVVPNISSPYTRTSLTNYHKYWFGVRAKDSKLLSETNTVKMSATPRSTYGNGNLIWAKRSGGPSDYSYCYDYGRGITTLSDNSTVVTGVFCESATFGQGEPNQTILTSVGGGDIFIARYNPNGTLAWAKRAGGSGGGYDYESGKAITTLSDNSTVVTGSFCDSATFGPGEPNQTVLTSAGYSDIFIARYNPDGTLAWAKRAGGLEWGDWGRGTTTLSDNSTVVTGWFFLSATFGPGESNQTVLTSAGGSDIFIARYNPNGTLAWAKRAGGSEWDYGYGITTLSDNSTVVTGYFSDSATFGPSEPNQTVLTSAGWDDIFIARYNPYGTLSWAKHAGGSGWDKGYGITTLSDNSTVVTGEFEGSATFGPGESNQTVLTSAGYTNIFIARYNPYGTLLWAKRAGGADWFNGGIGITTLSDNSTVVTGYFWYSATFGPSEPNQTVLTSAGADDIFIARYNPNGTLAWAKRAGGANNDAGLGITTLFDNSTVVTGFFCESATFGPGEPNQTILTSDGLWDIFIARFAP